ncbi:MAG: methyltransferase domain-containing protein [Desulfobacterales bacterium]|jgi:ubiquinone/menaquinone biosynthesis C-methylase UbiE
MQNNYVHGFSESEGGRLNDQARTLEDLLHHDTRFPAGHTVLEAGCGTGAQTEILARRCPGAEFMAIDLSETALTVAKERLRRLGAQRVIFAQADIYRLPFPKGHFDHVMVCFLLEHLTRPPAALRELKRVLAPGGTLTAIEGDHGSFYCHPETPEARQVVQCLIDLQAECGGDALIGRRLYPLLKQAGFENVRVSPRVVYVDESRPEWEEGFSRKTFIAMIEGVASQALRRGLMASDAWEKGVRDLRAATGAGSSFHYTFFKGLARVALDGDQFRRPKSP